MARGPSLPGFVERHTPAFPPRTDWTVTKLEYGCSIARKRPAARFVSDAQTLHRTYRGTSDAVLSARLRLSDAGNHRSGAEAGRAERLSGKGLVGMA